MEFSDLDTVSKLGVILISGAFWFVVGFIFGKVTATICGSR